jgi:hypothetical protein
MWDTTNLDVKSYGATAVVSHISRKTSEIWGTRQLLRGQGLGV